MRLTTDDSGNRLLSVDNHLYDEDAVWLALHNWRTRTEPASVETVEQRALDIVADQLRESNDFETAMRVLTAIWRRA